MIFFSNFYCIRENVEKMVSLAIQVHLVQEETLVKKDLQEYRVHQVHQEATACEVFRGPLVLEVFKYAA